MRILWTLFKIMLGLAIAIPVGMFALALTLGIAGTVARLAFVAVRLTCVGLVGYGVYRVGRLVMGRPARRVPPPAIEPPRVDPYYEAAMRELDTELGPSR
jgi:hypothetical protein